MNASFARSCRSALLLSGALLTASTVRAADPAPTYVPYVPAPDAPRVYLHMSTPAGEERESRLQAFEVTQSIATLTVTFTLSEQDAADPAAMIRWATVKRVPLQSRAAEAGFKVKDELVRLNGHPIHGLTLAEFGQLVYTEQEKGGLTWKVNRGFFGRSLDLPLNLFGDAVKTVSKSAEPSVAASSSHMASTATN